jgi:Holliday junction resolvasome RuvABC endonuclease subunit
MEEDQKFYQPNDGDIYRIVSFDPASTKNCGWSVLNLNFNKKVFVDFNCIAGTMVLPKVEEPWQMLFKLFSLVDEFLEKYTPHKIIIEKTSSFSGGFICGQVSNCMGVILAACGKHGIPVEFIYPTHAKKKVTGKGKATKSVMKKCVKNIFEHFNVKTDFDSEHSIDAAANILCWLFDQNVIKNPIIEE